MTRLSSLRRSLFPLVLALLVTPATAQQMEDFGEYVIHYNAMGTAALTPEVARAYGIERSPNKAMLIVSVMEKDDGGFEQNVAADVAVRGTNLTGQQKDVPMKEVVEPDGATYYIGQMSVYNMETYNFHVTARVDDRDEPMEIDFRQQFFTE